MTFGLARARVGERGKKVRKQLKAIYKLSITLKRRGTGSGHVKGKRRVEVHDSQGHASMYDININRACLSHPRSTFLF